MVNVPARSDLLAKYYVDLKKKDLKHTACRWLMITYGFGMWCLQRWIYYLPTVYHFIEQIMGYSDITVSQDRVATSG